MAVDFEAVAKSFTTYYYQTFDQNRSGLAPLYHEQSMLTFESEKLQGVSAIMQKLTTLRFQKVVHDVVSMDSQPSTSGGILIFVNGKLVVDDQEQPLRFSEVFHLMDAGGGNYVVTNHMFRLNYG